LKGSKQEQKFVNDTTSPKHDIMPLSEEYKSRLSDHLMALSTRSRLTDDNFNLLWQLIESATWEYRQTAPRNTLDVDDTLDCTAALAHQCDKLLGMNSADFERLAMLMVRLCICAGFFGIYLDRWMYEQAVDVARPSSTNEITEE
jgi:hypothetical protein